MLRVNAQLADPRFTELEWRVTAFRERADPRFKLEWRVTAFRERDVSKALISVVAIGFPDKETAITCIALGGVDEWPRVVKGPSCSSLVSHRHVEGAVELAVPAPPQWFDHAVSVMLLSVEEGTLNV